MWFFPTGTPHSIQGLGPNGREFLLVFDDGAFSEDDTTLLTDFTRHVPHEVLAKNWSVPESALAPLYQVPEAGYYIFQRAVPGQREEAKRAAAGSKVSSPLSFSFQMGSMQPALASECG